MAYKKLDLENLQKLTPGQLRIWVKTLANKLKRVGHSEALHKYDSAYYKRLLAKHATTEQMKQYYKQLDINRATFEKSLKTYKKP
jgi:predicted transcriptional regulator